MGSFMPLIDPYVGSVEIWVSSPTKLVNADSWLMHFSSPWRADGVELPERGWSNYISDKLAELDPTKARYLRGRTPESCAKLRCTSTVSEEWLMSPFFERSWWSGFHERWTVGDSVPPEDGWSAHDGGRNQLYPLIAYRNRINLTDVRFLSAKSHECAPDGAIRRSHHR